jgi:predicted alpha/beta-hydrolase family hydrolase
MRMSSNKSAPESDPSEVVSIPVDDAIGSVSGLLQRAESDGAGLCYVAAHGAGAGMRHSFLQSMARGLAGRGISSLRYQFPYMEQGSKRPDSPKVAHAAVRAAVGQAAALLPKAALFAGGKSFGGRMTSQAQAAAPLPGVHGLVFLGFPLHRPGESSEERAEHLFEVKIPMLFLQGTHDEFAETRLLESVIDRLGERATLKLFADADHSFHVPARTGKKDVEVQAELFETMKHWMEGVAK